MSNLTQRLDDLREQIQKPEFLEGKGLSNEVNIRIFCYDPKDEMAVRYFTQKLVNDPGLNCHLVECNLYHIFLSICDELDITDAILEMEKADGKNILLKQLHSAIGAREYIKKIQYEPHNSGKDVLLLTGVGEVFPFMRIHTLLEALQPYFSDIPILVLYPGEFNGRCLKLFNKLQPNDYYRAFNIIKEENK